MDDLTDAAFIASVDMLRQQNIQVRDDAKKVLTIAIVGAYCQQEFWASNYMVELNVIFKDGSAKKSKLFKGSQRHALIIPSVVINTYSYAINDAVFNMLKDNEITKYLIEGDTSHEIDKIKKENEKLKEENEKLKNKLESVQSEEQSERQEIGPRID
ncbi:MAG TPA: hypothetical protein VHO90_09585 [Bacteroidales bacterium]|nr:hypothetical protein [Bacteroidales bacterium]